MLEGNYAIRTKFSNSHIYPFTYLSIVPHFRPSLLRLFVVEVDDVSARKENVETFCSECRGCCSGEWVQQACSEKSLQYPVQWDSDEIASVTTRRT